ncbi:MAG: hypothetical protein GX752_05745 [Clostridium sp.]|nr:hypothetical protein [Clostridium sp.]
MEYIDELNAKMEFLVNRTDSFDRKKFSYFLMDKVEDNEKYFLCYQVLKIISLVRNVPLYVSKRTVKEIDWIDPEYIVSPIRMFFLKIKNEGIQYSMSTKDERIEDCMCPKIYWGMTTAEVNELAKELYKYGN